MIAHIARREVLGHLRAPRFLALCVLSVVLLGSAAYLDARRLHARVTYADALEAQRQVAVALDARRDPDAVSTRYGWRSGRGVSDPGLRAVRPPSAASALALGADLTSPGFWQFDTEGLTVGPATDADDSLATRGAALDFEFIVRAVLSLVALLLAADAFAGERESGVLRTLLSAPVSRLDVLLGKCVGGLVTLCVPLVAGGSLTAVVLLALDVPLLDPDVWPRAALLLVGAVLYLAGVFVLGAAASARCREARTATVVLVVGWVCAVFIVPNGAALAASVVAPVTPAEVLRQRRVDAIVQLEAERGRTLARLWRVASGGDSVPRDGVIAPDTRARYDRLRAGPEAALVERKRAAIRSLDDGRNLERARQDRFAALFSAASPAWAFNAFASAVAGTGASMRARWDRAASDHQRRLEISTFDRPFGAEVFDARVGYMKITFLPDPRDPAGRVPLFAELPPFAAPGASLEQDLHEALGPLALLVAEAVAALALAAVAVLRMEVAP